VAHTIFHQLLISIRAIVKGICLLATWFLVGLAGILIWMQFEAPFKFIFGLPLFLIGLTMGLQALYEMIVGFFSLRWGRTHCPFCSTSKEVKKILSPFDGFKN